MQERDYAREYGNRCRQIRQAKGLSQQDVADKMHTTPQNVSKWEKEGISNVNTVMKLSEVLGQDITADQIDQEGTVGEIGKEILMLIVQQGGQVEFRDLSSQLFGLSEDRISTELFKLERIGTIIREQFNSFFDQPLDMVYITAKGIITIKNLRMFGLPMSDLEGVFSYESRIKGYSSMQERTEIDQISKILWDMPWGSGYKMHYIIYLKNHYRADMPDGTLYDLSEIDYETNYPKSYRIGVNCFVDLIYSMITGLTRQKMIDYGMEAIDEYVREDKMSKLAYKIWGGDVNTERAQKCLSEKLPFVKYIQPYMYALESTPTEENEEDVILFSEMDDEEDLKEEEESKSLMERYLDLPEKNRDNCAKWFTRDEVEEFVKENYIQKEEADRKVDDLF